MKLYRIYTENKNLAEVLELVNARLEGYTVLQGTGYWQGKPEPCLVLECIGDDKTGALVAYLAADIKVRNAQETVLFTCQDVKEAFL